MNLRSRNIPSIYDENDTNTNYDFTLVNEGIPIMIIMVSLAYISYSLFESYKSI